MSFCHHIFFGSVRGDGYPSPDKASWGVNGLTDARKEAGYPGIHLGTTETMGQTAVLTASPQLFLGVIYLRPRTDR